jgi:hypothetical protein
MTRAAHINFFHQSANRIMQVHNDTASLVLLIAETDLYQEELKQAMILAQISTKNLLKSQIRTNKTEVAQSVSVYFNA